MDGCLIFLRKNLETYMNVCDFSKHLNTPINHSKLSATLPTSQLIVRKSRCCDSSKCQGCLPLARDSELR